MLSVLIINETVREKELFLFLIEKEAVKGIFILLEKPRLCWRNESWNYLPFEIQFQWCKSTIEHYLNNTAHVFFVAN